MPRVFLHARCLPALGIFFALGLFARVFAFEPVASWLNRTYQTEDGLPDNSITGIAQTSDGQLWVGTRGGLLCYNGQNFSLLPEVNLPLLPSRTVRAVFRDHRDQVWIGMERGPLICVRHDGLKIYSTKDGLPQQRLMMMTEDGEGALWIVYASQVRRMLNGVVQSISLPDEWSGGPDVLLGQDSTGDVWCAKGSYVGVWHDGIFKTSYKFRGTVTALGSGSRSNMWAATAGGHLFKFNAAQAPIEAGQLPADPSPRILLEDHAGALWIGTSVGGLFHWDGHQLEKVPTSQQQITCLFEDREENIWAGTEGGGLNLIRQRTAAIIDRQAGLPFESVRSITEDASSCVWAVSQEGYLARATNGQWNVLSKESVLNGGSAICVTADRKGVVWVGTASGGLKSFEKGEWHDWQLSEMIPSVGIRSLMASSNGDLWIGADFPYRLIRLRHSKFQVITNTTSLGPIRALAEDSQGTIWIGTSEGKVLRVQGETLVADPAIVEPVPLSVRSLLATPDGHLWIGYAGDGLGHLKDGKYTRLTSAIGLADDFISQMQADENGNLWINANRGLSRVSISGLEAVCRGESHRVKSQSYGRLDGLPAMQPSRDYCPTSFQSRDGHLWFALHSGILAVQPEFIQDNPYPPPVFLETVSVDDHVVAAYDATSPMRPKTFTNAVNLHGLSVPLQLGPDHRKLEINFAALSFASPENVQLRYRLSRFDADWNDAGPNRHAVYPRLPAGDYEFQVIACNNSGVWNETGAQLKLRVMPFFYETWWFKVGGAVVTILLAGSITFWISRRRYRQKLRRLEARRALEQERARIAKDIHDDLGATLTRISLLSQPPQDGADDSQTSEQALAQIHQTARDLTHAMGEVVWAVNPEHDTFDSLANYISHYAQNFLRTAAIRCRLEMPLELPKRSVSAEVRHNLFLAFKEALNNVVKHSQATEVRISLAPEASGFVLSVEDNGKGFSIDASASSVAGEKAQRAVPGNGLGNMKSRLEEIGGECDVQGMTGAGTKIIFRVKLKSSHGNE